jgi:hypothetical protein
MADFGDLVDETDDEAAAEPQTTTQAAAVRGGLLSPSTFPSILRAGAGPDGPAIAPQPPILSGPLDPDVHAEVLQDVLDAQARLPPLAPAQGPGDPGDWDGRWLDPASPQITGPLDTDTHAEVLRDIQNAQAQLPAASRRSVHSPGNAVVPTISISSFPYSFGRGVAPENDGTAQLPYFGGSQPSGNAVSSFVFADPASKLKPLDPNITYIGGQPFRTVDTGKAERLVPDVRVSAGPFVPALTPGEALQKSVQENIINPSLFMMGGGEGVPSEWAPSGPTLPFPADIAAANGYPDIGTTENGGPTFVGTKYLYPVAQGQLNVVEIPLTGSRRKDVKAANAIAGFARTPRNYTWHHVDDFNPAAGTGSLELVERDAHEATNPHSGSVAQYEKFFGNRYNR